MPFLQLTGGAYKTRSLIAAAQRCVNLYVEQTPQVQGEPFGFTHYCTPGLTLEATWTHDICRGLYQASNGDLWAVYDQQLLWFDSSGVWHQVGTLTPSDPSDATPRYTPVSMCDNGTILIVVDGSVDGWFANVVTHDGFARIDRNLNSGFYGANYVSYQDTFFIFDKPNTPIFYCSLSEIGADQLTKAYSVASSSISYHVTDVSVVAAGSGYTVNDVLTLNDTGGAQVTVTAVDGSGGVSTVNLTNGGSFATVPTLPDAVIGGTGTGATFTGTATVIGTGYEAGDVLTLTGAGGAQVTVNTVDTQGHILTYSTTNGGYFDTQPTNPVATTGGFGSGATFVLDFITNTGAFDPLDFASAVGQAGYLVAAISMHRTIWLIGTNSYEVWINNGGSGTATDSFPFTIYPEAFGNWGCAAKYSIATILNQIFWLSQDKFGHALLMKGEGLQTKRASTYAIEYQISQYERIDDAIAYCYQQEGHVFYVITFPSANSARGVTWVYDSSSNEWHERPFIDDNGIEYRHLSNACAAAYGKVYCGDWRNGNLYSFDTNNYTDNGQPIIRKRSFPHEVDLQANRRVVYTQAIAQMQVGTSGAATGTTQRVISSDFEATDGTLLQDFSDPNSIGASFTKVGAVDAVILSDAVTASASGDVLYEASGVPISADYFVQFRVVPDSYASVPTTGALLYGIGRADGSNNGYQAGISSDGSAYSAFLTVMGGATTTVAAGTLDSGYYQVQLQMLSTSITVSVLRSADGLWLNSSGSWVGSQVAAIAIDDSTYILPGRILVGGTWE